jgi:hypothetical protein
MHWDSKLLLNCPPQERPTPHIRPLLNCRRSSLTEGWVNVVLKPTQIFFCFIIVKVIWFSMRWWWCVLCTRPTHLVGSYSASSLKQQSVNRHVSPLKTLSCFWAKPVFALSPKCCVLSGEAANTNFIVFDLSRPGSNPQSTVFKVSTLTITPPMLLSRLTRVELLCWIFEGLTIQS